MDIKRDDLTGSEIQMFVKEHWEDMHRNSRPESCHALALDELRRPDITFWSAWSGQELLGCGALKQLDPEHGEIKSMRTAIVHRNKGVATKLLNLNLGEARSRHYTRESKETGSMELFAPARKLYAKFGFKECQPFAEYFEDPESLFMTKEL